jgi:hypothetical protein
MSIEAFSNPLEPPAKGNVFMPMDEALFSARDLRYIRAFAGNAAFADVPISIVPAEDRDEQIPTRTLIDRRAEVVSGNVLPPELTLENALFLSVVRVPVSSRDAVVYPGTGIGLLTARYLVDGQGEETIFTFEQRAARIHSLHTKP